MKYVVLVLFVCFYSALFSQPDTEVYLFDLKSSESKLELINQRNISKNQGYDNQPSFYNDNLILMASTRNGQTDIATYNIRDKAISFVNSTPKGGEYSPLKIPNSKDISAVRLDEDGKQRLYRYNFQTGKYKELITDLVVAYYMWYNKSTIIAAIIEGSNLNGYIVNITTGKRTKFAEGVGRSFHHIPNSKLVSFISKGDKTSQLSSLDPVKGEVKKIMSISREIEDLCWLNNGSIVIPINNIVYTYNPKSDQKFKILAKFEDNNLQKITRIATNSTNSMLSFVSVVSPEVIVQKQLEAYNKRDIDAFMSTYTNNIKLLNFPNTLRSEGQESMRKNYQSFFENTPNLNCKILKRIVVGNKVIDHELVTANNNTFKAVAIYEVENGLISKVTFVR